MAFKVGQAPWEINQPQGFKVGQAPWEVSEPQVKPEISPSMGRMGFRPKVDNPTGALEAIGRTLDYPGGLIRTGLAGVADLPNSLSGNPNVMPEDVTDALQGKAPTTSEYMKRLGVPEGPSVAGVSARDAAGFLGDIGTDPLSFGSKVFKPASELTEGLGKKIYKSGFKKIDERLLEKGKKPISEIALETGLTGTTKDIKEGLAKKSKQLLEERSGIYKAADEAGKKVDISKVVSEADSIIAEMRKDPGLAEQADALAEYVNKYRDLKEVPVSLASDIKSNLYEALPSTSFSPYGVKGSSKKVQKSIAKGFKEEIEKNAGDGVKKINEDLSSLIESRRPVDMQIRRGETPNLVTSTDAIMSGTVGAVANPLAAAGTVGAKKLIDLSKTTWARTNLGKGLIDAAKTGLLDAPVNRGLINVLRPEDLYSPVPVEEEDPRLMRPPYTRLRPLGSN